MIAEVEGTGHESVMVANSLAVTLNADTELAAESSPTGWPRCRT